MPLKAILTFEIREIPNNPKVPQVPGTVLQGMPMPNIETSPHASTHSLGALELVPDFNSSGAVAHVAHLLRSQTRKSKPCLNLPKGFCSVGICRSNWALGPYLACCNAGTVLILKGTGGRKSPASGAKSQPLRPHRQVPSMKSKRLHTYRRLIPRKLGFTLLLVSQTKVLCRAATCA